MKTKINKLRSNVLTIGVICALMVLWMINIKAKINANVIVKDNYLIADSIITLEKNNSQIADSLFNVAVDIIKKYEGWHSKKHYPYVGYGHRLLPQDTFNWDISEDFATQLLKKDLKQKCSVFREFGKDSLILGVLAYNIGEYKIKGGYGYVESELVRKIKAGDRDIYQHYISYSRYKGRVVKSIQNRRIEEFNKLYINE